MFELMLYIVMIPIIYVVCVYYEKYIGIADPGTLLKWVCVWPLFIALLLGSVVIDLVNKIHDKLPRKK